MKIKFYFFILLLLITFTVHAEGYLISVKWEGMKDSTLILTHYYDSNIYVKDTIQLDNNGKGEFSGDEKLKEGLYMLFVNNNARFDFLLGSDQTFNIETKSKDFVENLSIKGASESEDFLTYQKLVKNKIEEKNTLLGQLKSKDKDSTEFAKTELERIDAEMEQYMDKTIANAGNNMLGLFLNAANSLKIPKPDADESNPKYDSIAWFHSYNYRRDHFFDGINLADERILNTPLLKPKLEAYFNKILLQTPDSIIPQAYKLLNRAEENPITYQYLTQFLINNSLQSKIMGMDAVFLAVADEVYLKGKATWADSATIAKVAEEAYLTRYNLIGNKAPELFMENIDGEMESLHQIIADYTVLIFYEYDCGHCKKDIPALYNDVYLKFIEHNIEVFAVCMEDDHEKWKEFVDSNGLEGWHHMWDPSHKTKFRFKYNTKTAPTLYLLDKDKTIIAKKIDNSTLTSFLNSLLKLK